MTQSDTENTGVIMPPPIIYLLALVLALILEWMWPWSLPWAGGDPVRFWLGGILLLAGLLINGWGVYTLSRSETAIHPNRPASRIVTSGPFRLSRNPLYMGLNVFFLGLIVLIDSLWGLLLWIPVLVIMHYGVIRREEQHLQARFGEAFREYRERVRRYL